VSDLPAACKALLPTMGAATRAAPNGTVPHQSHLASCIQSAGFRQFTTYQPISRFWAFQSIETVIFLALAAALVAVAVVVVRRRDA
jgi:hypothetical protein